MTDTNARPLGPATAVVFPGQGSQRAGMGRDFHDRFVTSRLAYDEASDALGLDLRSLCFHDDPRLSLTEYSQPAIVATQVAMLRGLGEGWGFAASFFGGHSLGEYSALVAAGVFDLADAVRIVRERGRLMQEAAPVGHGAMLAVLGDDLDRIAITASLLGTRVSIANDNSRGQVVLSGPADEVHDAGRRLEAGEAGNVSRVVELDVSAPFHSWMMRPAETRFADVLASRADGWKASRATRVTSNLTGAFHDGDAASLQRRLVGQLSGTVRWRDNMKAIASRARSVFEVGPSRPLRAFFRTIGLDVTSVVDVRSGERAFAAAAAA